MKSKWLYGLKASFKLVCGQLGQSGPPWHRQTHPTGSMGLPGQLVSSETALNRNRFPVNTTALQYFPKSGPAILRGTQPSQSPHSAENKVQTLTDHPPSIRFSLLHECVWRCARAHTCTHTRLVTVTHRTLSVFYGQVAHGWLRPTGVKAVRPSGRRRSLAPPRCPHSCVRSSVACDPQWAVTAPRSAKNTQRSPHSTRADQTPSPADLHHTLCPFPV